MKAAFYEQFGEPDVIRIGERPEPPLGPDVIRLRAKAISVNPVDWKIRKGFLRGAFPHHLPIIPGWDVAGVVESVGPAVQTGLEQGDEVWGYVRRDDVHSGTAAELVIAPQRTVARKPKSLSFAEAAAVPLAGLTAYQCLTEALNVQKGDRILVHAASGGVGQFAVQLARAFGAEVIGTSSAKHHAYLLSLGCSEALDYHAGPISQQLKARVDAVVDLVGGDALADAPKQVKDVRRIVSVVDPRQVLSMGGRYVFVRPEQEHLDALAQFVEKGKLKVDVARSFPLEELADAHRMSEQGHTRGKIVVTIG